MDSRVYSRMGKHYGTTCFTIERWKGVRVIYLYTREKQMDFRSIAKLAIDNNVSDIFITAGLPISAKLKGTIAPFSKMNNNIEEDLEKKLMPDDTQDLIHQIYSLADDRTMNKLQTSGDDDFAFAIKGISRFRVNAYKQRGTYAAVIRVIAFNLPDPSELGIGETILSLSKLDSGLALVTGPAGSGKSTTLACVIDEINNTKKSHIITLEDPLEYLHSHKESIVTQREIDIDTKSFVSALRAALRQSPNVILIGELRDDETIEIAMTAAETGHLVISTLHTVGAANSIGRIVDSFPPAQQQQILLQLSMVIQIIVSQQLIPTKDGQVVPVFEVITVTPAIRNMIREGKVHQIDNMIETAAADSGMISMDKSLLALYQEGRIEKEIMMKYASNPDMLAKRTKMLGI